MELLRPAGDGVIAPAACLLDHIQGVLVQQPGGGRGRSAVALPPGPGGVAPAAQGPGGLAGEVVQLDPCRCQQAAGAPVFLPQQAQEQVAAVHLAVTQAAGLANGGLHTPLQLGGEGAAPRQRGPGPPGLCELLQQALAGQALGGQQPPGAALAVLQQAQEQVLAAHGIVAQALGQGPGGFQPPAGGGGNGDGLDGVPSSLAPLVGDGGVGGVTEMLRAGWLAETGAPSKAGVAEPKQEGFGVFSM